MDTCEKTLLRYPPPLPPARRCFGSFNTWTPEYQRHRGPLPGGLVHRWEVLRAMDTCEKTPCRYSLALPCPCFLNTWTPDNGRHRGPLPGGQVLATLELRSLLTSIYIPAHVFPSLVSKCSLAQWSLGEPIAPRAAILFWPPFCFGWVPNICRMFFGALGTTPKCVQNCRPLGSRHHSAHTDTQSDTQTSRARLSARLSLFKIEGRAKNIGR